MFSVPSFAALYSRHYPRVLRTVRRRVHDRAEAEDLAQETFTQALAGLGQLRRPERFYPWLAAIARHMVARHHRVSARLCVIADVDPGRFSDAPDSELLRRVDADNLNAALNRVRVRHREVLSMREDEGLSYEEIAARLGTPASTVPPLLFRARQSLRREYLAITEPRLALWPLALLAVRRAKMRLLYGTHGLPTAAASSTVTVAFVAASVGALLLPLNPVPSPLVGMPPSAFCSCGQRRRGARRNRPGQWHWQRRSISAPACARRGSRAHHQPPGRDAVPAGRGLGGRCDAASTR